MQILGIRGRKSEIEEQCFVECHRERWRPKNGSIPSRNKKEESIWSLSVAHRQTDRQTESTTKNNRLLA